MIKFEIWYVMNFTAIKKPAINLTLNG